MGKLDAGGMAAGFEALKNAMAYSGEVDPAKLLLGTDAGKTYAISASFSNGEETRLVAGIHGIGEAFLSERSAQRAMGGL